MKVSGIILAGGSSTRYGTGDNKTLAMLCGRPVLEYSHSAMMYIMIGISGGFIHGVGFPVLFCLGYLAGIRPARVSANTIVGMTSSCKTVPGSVCTK